MTIPDNQDLRREDFTMGQKRILVVDDNFFLSRTIDMCLSKKGHDVKVLSTGADAIKYLFEEKPDSIVLDIKLPDCDGWFVARLLGKLDWGKDVPLIVTSVMDPDGGKIAEIKPYAYIQKPFDMGLLMQTVESSLSTGNPCWQMAPSTF
jgi:DNA-binding response OmpR family regulator